MIREIDTESDHQQEIHSLPGQWEWTELGSICDAINGRAFKSTEWQEAGIPIIRIQNLKNTDAPFNYFQGELESRHTIKGGDLLFAWSGTPGTSFGAHIWRGPDAALNQHIFKIEFDQKRIDKVFFCHALNQNVSRYVKQAQGGVGLAHITKNKFLASKIPLPPLHMQKRIVAEIEKQVSRLDEAVTNLKRVKANLKRYRASVLKAAVEGRLVETEAEIARREGREYETGKQLLERILETRRREWKGKGQYKEPSAPDVSELPEVPEGWAWGTVEQISGKVVDGVHKKPNYIESGIPFVTVRNLTAGSGISFERINYVSQQDHESFCKRTNPQRGDILITKDGTLGVVRLVDTDRPFSIFVSVILVKPVDYSLSHYLVLALESPVVQRQMVPKGSGLQHIHLEDLRVDCIPLPPLAEQQRIVAEVDRRLSLVRETEAQVEANLKRAERLRQSVLQKAFSGELVRDEAG